MRTCVPKNMCVQVAGFQLFSISPLDVRAHDCLLLRITESFGGPRVSVAVASSIGHVSTYFVNIHKTAWMAGVHQQHLPFHSRTGCY